MRKTATPWTGFLLIIGIVSGTLTLFLAGYLVGVDRDAPRSCAPEWGIYYQQVSNDDPHSGAALEHALMCEESK